MTLTRATKIGVAGGALAAWLAAAATSGIREPTKPITNVRSPIDRRGEMLATEVSRLHERLRPSAMPKQPGRNLFSFVSPKARSSPAREPIFSAARAALSDALAARPPLPPLKLSGIAEDATPDGPVRTAIVSGFGQLFFVKEGDRIRDRYRVVKISSEVAELTDTDDGSTIRLALR
jgi:hypothetical protein